MHQSFILCAVTVFASMAAADDRQTTRLHPAGGGPSMSLTPLFGLFGVSAGVSLPVGGFTLSARFLFAGEPQSGTDARVEFVGFPVQNDSYTKDFALPMFQFSVGYTY